jgi:4-oxalocrotonate tautomerase
MTQKKEALIEKVTLAIYESLGAPIETIRVIINEMPKQHYGIAGNSAKKLGK